MHNKSAAFSIGSAQTYRGSNDPLVGLAAKDRTLVILAARKQGNVMRSSIYRYLSVITTRVCVRVNARARLYRLRAQHRRPGYRFDICRVSRLRVGHFFPFELPPPCGGLAIANPRHSIGTLLINGHRCAAFHRINEKKVTQVPLPTIQRNDRALEEKKSPTRHELRVKLYNTYRA